MSGEHKFLPFTGLHKAKFDAGLAADAPASPEGAGDLYLCTDTHVLKICYDGSAWVDIDLDDISAPVVLPARSTAKLHLASDVLIPDGTPTTIVWDTADWDDEGYYTGFDGAINPPTDNVYEMQYLLYLDNSTPTSWIVDIFINGVASDLDSIEVGITADLYYMSYTTKLYLPSLPVVQIVVEQNSGGDLNVLSFSWLTIQKIEN